jgi:uncharacterized protein HemX
MIRRTSQQSDTIIIEKLGELKTNLALNTQSTENIEGHLVQLNGKVAAHESRLQSNEGSIALMSSSISQMQVDMKSNRRTRQDWLDWLIKAIIVIASMLFYTVLTNTGIVKDFLKR